MTFIDTRTHPRGLVVLVLFVSAALSCSVSYLEDRIVAIKESEIQPVLCTISVDSVPGGIVRIEPSETAYLKGTLVKAEAKAHEGYRFEGFSGTRTGSSDKLVFTIEKDEWLIPVFTPVDAPPATAVFRIRVDTAAGGGVRTEPPTAITEKGTLFSATAIPAAGYTFVEWKGTRESPDNPLIFEAEKNEWFHPVFQAIEPVREPERFTINVSRMAGGSAWVAPETAEGYTAKTLVSLSAAADPGYEFTGWAGTLAGSARATENPLILAVQADEWIIPVFRKLKPEPEPPAEPTYTIKVDPVDHGSALFEPVQDAYAEGEIVRIYGKATNTYEFAYWSGTISSTDNPLLLRVTKDEWLIPVFRKKTDPATLTLKLDSAEGGTAVAEGAKAAYAPGNTVKLRARPDAGWRFVGWAGTVSGAENPFILEIHQNEWIFPVFERIPAEPEPEPEPEPPAEPTYTVRADYTANGTCTVDPALAQYAEGSFVKITATPAPGYLFSGWNGTVQSMQNPLVARVTDHIWVIPVFSKEPRYTLITEKTGTGGTVRVAPDKSGEYAYGDLCTLTATPDPGYEFSGWYGDVSGTQPVLTVSMTRDIAAHPQFTLIPVVPQYTIRTSAGAYGTITLTPKKDAYGSGETVHVTAQPAAGYIFKRWTEGTSGTDSDATVIVTDNITVGAEFVPATWTHLVYMCADNSLDSQALNDLNEMEAAVRIADKGMTVLVLVDRKYGNGDWSDTRLYEIRNTPGVNSALIESKRLDCPELGLSASLPTELNMSDPVTLERFIRFGLTSRKAQRYSLTVWGHGTGWRGAGTEGAGTDGAGTEGSTGGEGSAADSAAAAFRAVAIDDTSGTYMDVGTLAEAVRAGRGTGNRIDVIGFDSCFGALLEVAYPLRNDVRFLVGSEGPTKESGWNYTGILNDMCSSNLDAADWYGAIVGQFAISYASMENATISAIDLGRVGALQQSFNEWARSVAQQVGATEPEGARNGLKDSIRRTILTTIDSYCYPSMKSDFYADVASLAGSLKTVHGSGNPDALKSAVTAAIPLSWSRKYGYTRRQIGVFVNTISASRIFDTSHSPTYTAGSGSATNPFVTDTPGWVPSVDSGTVSFLNMLFY